MSVSPSPVAPARRAGWWRRKVTEPLLGLLKQGLSPAQLSLTVALGVGCGLVPLLGITTALGSFVALRLRLNVAATLLVSHLMSPVQLLILVPLLQWGAKLLGSNAMSAISLEKLRYLLAHDLPAAWSLLWRAELGALLLWAVLMAPLMTGLYFGLRPVFHRLAKKQARNQA